MGGVMLTRCAYLPLDVCSEGPSQIAAFSQDYAFVIQVPNGRLVCVRAE